MIDHTGYIKYTEFIAACLDARDYTEESAVHEAFHRLDVNRSGGITRENMIALLKDQLIMEIKDQSVEDVVDEMFRTGDKDGTGEINISDLKAILEEDELEDDGDLDWRTASNHGMSGSSQTENSQASKDASSLNDIGLSVTDTGE